MDMLGPHNAFWDDGDWIGWDSLGDEDDFGGSHLAKLEYEAELKFQYPNADISLVPIYQTLLETAGSYFQKTGKHLQVFGDIGELYGAITYGIKLHRNYAQGSDGRLGDDFVEVKTITPFNTRDKVMVKLTGNFSKLLVVKVSEDFSVSGQIIDRKKLPKSDGGYLRLSWEGLKTIK